jgi:O-antigen ligase
MIHEKGVQGHSVTQRIVFWKTGWQIFKEHWFLGVGTGDSSSAFEEMYNRTDARLSEQNRLRAHNQFLSIALTLGIVGFLIFLVSIAAPFLLLKNANSFLYIGFSIILYASMLNEDTLETQVGVTLYAFFNVFLLYGVRSLSGSLASTSS